MLRPLRIESVVAASDDEMPAPDDVPVSVAFGPGIRVSVLECEQNVSPSPLRIALGSFACLRNCLGIVAP